MMDFEKSNEEIVDLVDMSMMEEEKFSANFSEEGDEIISLDEDAGNFSDRSDPDVEEIEQWSTLNEINRHLNDRLEKHLSLRQ